MFDVKVTTTKPFSTERLVKYINNGVAIGLTKTAKEAQDAVQKGLPSHFTIRNRWAENSPIGIKIKAASGDRPSDGAEVFTKAPFGPRQQEGQEKLPYKNYLAIPIIPFARPTKESLIPKKNLPSNLKNAFILTTITGKKFLCIRKPKGRRAFSGLPRSGGRQTSGLVTMYQLVTKVKGKAVDFFYGPIEKVVSRRLVKNCSEGVDAQLRKFAERTA